MIIIISFIGLLVIIVLVGRIKLSLCFSREVKQLFSSTNRRSEKLFSYNQLLFLPGPVQKYFTHVLKEGQAYINCARITHGGQFRTGLNKGWINIKGEQYATTETPGFIWKGVTSMFTARDMYIADKGRLVVSLFSLYNIVDAKGEQYDKGELLRWLGESILYPTNLLPGERLQWSAIDPQTAKLTFCYNKLFLFFIVTFDEIGEIIQMETKRYMAEGKLGTWVIKLANYKLLNDVHVPTDFEVLWRLEKGDFSYVKFSLQNIEYDKPAKF